VFACVVSVPLAGVHATTGAGPDPDPDPGTASVPDQRDGPISHDVTNGSDPLPAVTGELTPQTPPAATTLTHELTIDAQAPLPNGTGILFPAPYGAADVTVAAVRTESNASTTLAVEETATGRALLRLRADRPVTDLRVDLTMSHPSRTNVTQQQLRVLAPGDSLDDTNDTVLAGYTILPIGSDRRAGPAGDFDRTDGSGYVYSGATVYRGEADISFEGALTDQLFLATGGSEDTPLEPPIPSDAPIGTYSTDGTNATANLTVRQPQITGFRIENRRGADVSDGVVLASGADRVAVIAQSNFEDAENLKITVETPDGLDVTNEVIEGPRIRQETDDGAPASTRTIADISRASASAPGQPHAHVREKRIVGPKVAGLSSSLHAQVDAQSSLDASRTVANSNLERGGSTTVTITSTVGPTGRIGISEEFSPTVRSAELQSITVDGESAAPLVAAADETGVAVAMRDLAPGATVRVEYTLGVEDDDQTYQVTGQVASGSLETSLDETTIVAGTGTSGTIAPGGRVRWELALGRVEATDVRITVTGADDLDTGDARVQSSLGINHDGPRLSLESETISQGKTNTVTVRNGIGGATYTTSIPARDVRSRFEGEEYYRVFQNVGTTKQVGVITDQGTYTDGTRPEGEVQAVYATLRIDPDDATGTTDIRTEYLADDVSVYLSGEPRIDPDSFDTATFNVTDPAVSLTEPRVYTTGESTTVAGTTSAGVDAVALYVHTKNGFELLDLDGRNGQVDGQLDVSDTTFSSDDIDLSSGDASGNHVLSIPGQYRIGVKPAAPLQRTTADGSLPRQLSEPEFFGDGAAVTTLSVQNTSLTLSRVGQNRTLATTATDLAVAGQATGSDRVLLVLVDKRGAITTDIIEHSGSSFAEELSIDDVAAGEADLYAVTTGRDGIVGDGQLPTDGGGTTLTDLAAYLNEMETRSTTPTQVGKLILSETQLAVGSDDRTAIEEIRVSEPRITITNITDWSPDRIDGLLSIRGHTNRRPSDATIAVTLRRNGEIRRYAQASEWAAGSWNTSLRTTNLSSGRYTVVAAIADVDDRQTVMLNRSASTRTPTPTTARPTPTPRSRTPPTRTTVTPASQSRTPPTRTTVTAPRRESSPTPASRTTPTVDNSPTTGANAPGFGSLLSLLSIIVCSLGYYRLQRYDR